MPRLQKAMGSRSEKTRPITKGEKIVLLRDFCPTTLSKNKPVVLTIDKIDATSVRLFFRLILMKFQDNIASGSTVEFRILIKDRDSNILHDEVKSIKNKCLSYEIDYSYEISNTPCTFEVSLVSDTSGYGNLSAVDFLGAKIYDNSAAFFLKTIKNSGVALTEKQLAWIGELQAYCDEIVKSNA